GIDVQDPLALQTPTGAGSGNLVSLQSNLGPITLAPGTYSADAAIGAFNGGSYTITATKLNVTGTTTVSASNNAGGHTAGTVSISLTDPSSVLTLSAIGGLNVDVHNGAGFGAGSVN